MNDLASTLYGGAPVAFAPTPAPASTPAQSAADTLYCQALEPPAPAPPAPALAPSPEGGTGDAVAPDPLAKISVGDVLAAIPSAIAEARKADTSRRLFGDQERDALAESFTLEDVAGMQPETRAAVRTELANMAADAGASRADVDVLRSALADAQANPMTSEQRIASRDAAISAFNEAYGDQAYKTLEITRAWIQQDPRRHAIFAQVGDSPAAALLASRLALAAQRRR